jgi:hypothetical protein
VIAYVFCHQPRPETHREDYERALVVFYQALSRARPAGLQRVSVLRAPHLPWLPADDPTFEEWYVLDDSAALDPLNDAAVSGDRLQPHNRVAAMSAAGVAGLYSLRLGDRPTSPPLAAQWFSKPDGMPYPQFFESLRPFIEPGFVLWSRRMVLGPTPEFCLHGPRLSQLPYPSLDCSLTPVFTQDVERS